MVIKFEQNPLDFKREIKILYELGLSQEEIAYIKYIKQKEERAEKWD